MKAAVYRGIEDIVIEEIPEPKLPKDGLVVKIEACGVCGSDVRTYYHGTHYNVPPMVLGHEVAGTVVEVGPECKAGYKVGDRLAVALGAPCGGCFFCSRGEFMRCLNPVQRDSMSGGFAQYMAIGREALERGPVSLVPEGLDLPSAAVSELAGSVTSCWENLVVEPIDTVVVIGAGPIGCLHCQMARIRGASLIIQADLLNSRLEMAKPFGADYHVNNGREDLAEFVKDKTGGMGAAIVIVAAPSAEACASGLDLLRTGGTLVVFGGLPPAASKVPFDGNAIHYREFVIRGAFGFSRRHQRTVLQLASEGRLELGKLITRKVPLSGVVDGIKSMSEGKDMKVVVEPWT